MTRVTKRFLLHNSRESEDIKESDFDELKMEFQAVKADMLNDIRGSKENLIRYSEMLYRGINLINQLFLKQIVRFARPDNLLPKLSKSSSPKNEDLENKQNMFRSFADMFQKDFDELYNPIYNRFSNMGTTALRSSPVINEK